MDRCYMTKAPQVFGAAFLRSGKWLYLFLFTPESGGITLIGGIPRHIPQLVQGSQ